MAAAVGGLETARLLMDAGADPDAVDGKGTSYTSEHSMSVKGLECQVPGLDNSGACPRPTAGCTPLVIAAEHDRVAVCRYSNI